MNFLAHFHLAWPDEGLVVGGLEGDYYKGRLRGDLAPEIARGVKLHRAIDAHTDQHAAIVSLRREFPSGLRRYAGILIDISFDHYLTLHWSRFGQAPLIEFNETIYRQLSNRKGELSPPAQAMAGRMLQHDILGRYHDWDAVTGTASRIGERFSRGNPLLDVARHIEPLRPALEATFLGFYPQLLEFSKQEQARLHAADC